MTYMSTNDIITQRQSEILQALAQYKYLTTSQDVDLLVQGDAKDKSDTNKLLKKMREGRSPLLGCHMFGGTHKFNQREYVYFLKPKGAKDLVLYMKQDPDTIKRPAETSTIYVKDYEHRKRFIDTQISLYRWAESKGYEVPLYDTYFDFTGNARAGTLRAKTSILLDPITKKRVVPDGLFFIDRRTERSLYAIEMHMGADTGRAMKQIESHKKTLDIGSASEHYGFNKGNRVLYVFNEAGCMRATMERVRQSTVITEPYRKYFLFASYNDILQDFDSWVSCESERINL